MRFDACAKKLANLSVCRDLCGHPRTTASAAALIPLAEYLLSLEARRAERCVESDPLIGHQSGLLIGVTVDDALRILGALPRKRERPPVAGDQHPAALGLLGPASTMRPASTSSLRHATWAWRSS